MADEVSPTDDRVRGDLAAGPKVLKQARSDGGQVAWKVELPDGDAPVRVTA